MSHTFIFSKDYKIYPKELFNLNILKDVISSKKIIVQNCVSNSIIVGKIDHIVRDKFVCNFTIKISLSSTSIPHIQILGENYYPVLVQNINSELKRINYNIICKLSHKLELVSALTEKNIDEIFSYFSIWNNLLEIFKKYNINVRGTCSLQQMKRLSNYKFFHNNIDDKILRKIFEMFNQRLNLKIKNYNVRIANVYNTYILSISNFDIEFIKAKKIKDIQPAIHILCAITNITPTEFLNNVENKQVSEVLIR